MQKTNMFEFSENITLVVHTPNCLLLSFKSPELVEVVYLARKLSVAFQIPSKIDCTDRSVTESLITHHVAIPEELTCQDEDVTWIECFIDLQTFL